MKKITKLVDTQQHSQHAYLSAHDVLTILKNMSDTFTTYTSKNTRPIGKRHKALMRNLLAFDFLGPRLEKNKTLIHTGSYHSQKQAAQGHFSIADAITRKSIANKNQIESILLHTLNFYFTAEHLNLAHNIEHAKTGYERGLLAFQQGYLEKDLQFGQSIDASWRTQQSQSHPSLKKHAVVLLNRKNTTRKTGDAALNALIEHHDRSILIHSSEYSYRL